MRSGEKNIQREMEGVLSIGTGEKQSAYTSALGKKLVKSRDKGS